MNNLIFFSLYSLSHQSPLFDSLIVFCANYLIYIIVIIVGFFVIIKNSDQLFDWRKPFAELKLKFNNLVFIFTPVVLAWISVSIVKNIFQFPRPFVFFADRVIPLFSQSVTDYSFPSGHSTFIAALAISVFFVNKKLGITCIIIALAVGISRIIAGVHFPIDILAGYIFGIVIAFIFKYIFKRSRG